MAGEVPAKVLGHSIGKLAERCIKRWLARRFPPRDEQILAAQDVLELTPEIRALDRVVAPLSVASIFGLMGGIYAGLAAVQHGLEPAAVNSVWDDRVAWPLLVPALLAGMALGWLPGRWYIRWRMGRERAEYYDHFKCTTEGWDETRLLRIACVVLLILAVALVPVTWAQGDLIDENGIRSSVGPVHSHHAFADVTAVEQYARTSAPIGVIDQPSLRVRFRSGSPLLIIAEGRAAELTKAAEYVSSRSGVPVTRGDIRPKN